MPRSRRRRLPAFATLIAVLLVATVARADRTAPKTGTLWEHWYTVEIGGATAGWMSEKVASEGDRYVSSSEAAFKISRGSVTLEITMRGEFVETHAGKPIRLHFVQDMALQSVDTVWEFTDDHVLSTSKQGGREITKEIPLPTGEWLTPMSVHRLLLERAASGAREITYSTIDGENGLEPTTYRHERSGAENVEFDGRTIPVTVWTTTTSALTGVQSHSKMSKDGHLVFEEVTLPFGRMVTRAATREQAMAAGAAPPPELMINTFVPLAEPLGDPSRATTATLRLRVKEGQMPEIPSAGAQRVRPGDDEQSALLEIDIDGNLPATEAELAGTEFIEPSTMVDGTDPLVMALARRATKQAGDEPYERAEAMRKFVHGHISAKALDTAFASASETAKMRTGDCSEHGVLLCAMLRANGIPARVASGLVYADYFAGERNIFGWHMWTQALIDGKWVDFDATLRVRYHPAHVLTGTSSLAEGGGSGDLASMMMLLGNLEIEVVEIR